MAETGPIGVNLSGATSLYARKEVVDGRATPGHDDGARPFPLKLAPIRQHA